MQLPNVVAIKADGIYTDERFLQNSRVQSALLFRRKRLQPHLTKRPRYRRLKQTLKSSTIISERKISNVN